MNNANISFFDCGEFLLAGYYGYFLRLPFLQPIRGLLLVDGCGLTLNIDLRGGLCLILRLQSLKRRNSRSANSLRLRRLVRPEYALRHLRDDLDDVLDEGLLLALEYLGPKRLIGAKHLDLLRHGLALRRRTAHAGRNLLLDARRRFRPRQHGIPQDAVFLRAGLLAPVRKLVGVHHHHWIALRVRK